MGVFGFVLMPSTTERTDEQVLRDLLQLTEKKIPETLKNQDLITTIRSIIDELESQGVDFSSSETSKETRMLAYDTATRFKDPKYIHHRSFFLTYVAQGKITPAHFPLYLNFFKSRGCDPTVEAAAFEKACGIGVTYTQEEIDAEVNRILDTKKDALEKSGWAFGYGPALGQIKKTLQFADSAAVVNALDAELTRRIGPRPSAEEVKNAAKQKAKDNKKGGKNKKAKKPEAEKSATTYETLPDTVQFPAPEENVQRTPELLAEHLKATGGKIRTRFPPEPNGYLHIGHAKSMNLNFGYAKKNSGVCYLRFDDTNPVKEKTEYIDSIIRSMKWLGHEPWKITYSSDYFQELYDLAVELIKRGKAFVCHQTGEEMARDRRAKVESPWRNRSVEENLRLFEEMRQGRWAEGKACLRMKADMQADNPNLRDLVAYRVIFAPHPHVGDKWCVYPTYDFTHCIVDSLENITHSLCTIEFENRKASYYWLLHALDMYCPPQIEFSRLNVSGYVMSKRKLTLLVEEGIVRGWDDPRLPTIEGLRRRGYTPAGINDLCERVGITRASNLISHGLLEECVRMDLDKKAPRAMAVLHPLKVTITNFKEEGKTVSVPDFPADPESTTHEVPFCKVIYIEREDFAEEHSKDFYRLTPSQNVGLKYISEGNIACKKVIKNASGEVVEILAELVPKEKVKSHIQWVSSPSSIEKPKTITVNMYDNLFLVEDLSTVGNFLDAINYDSLQVLTAYVDPSLFEIKGDHVQFERLGYFYRDHDSTKTRPIWNCTVNLKQDKSKAK